MISRSVGNILLQKMLCNAIGFAQATQQSAVHGSRILPVGVLTGKEHSRSDVAGPTAHRLRQDVVIVTTSPCRHVGVRTAGPFVSTPSCDNRLDWLRTKNKFESTSLAS